MPVKWDKMLILLSDHEWKISPNFGINAFDRTTEMKLCSGYVFNDQIAIFREICASAKWEIE